MAYFLQFGLAKLGSVGDHFTISPAGSSLLLFRTSSPPSIPSPQPRSDSASGTRHQEYCDHSLPSMARPSILPLRLYRVSHPIPPRPVAQNSALKLTPPLLTALYTQCSSTNTSAHRG